MTILKILQEFEKKSLIYGVRDEGEYIRAWTYGQPTLHIDLQNNRIMKGYFTKQYINFPNQKEILKYIKNYFHIKKYENINILSINTVLYLPKK